MSLRNFRNFNRWTKAVEAKGAKAVRVTRAKDHDYYQARKAGRIIGFFLVTLNRATDYGNLTK